MPGKVGDHATSATLVFSAVAVTRSHAAHAQGGGRHARVRRRLPRERQIVQAGFGPRASAVGDVGGASVTTATVAEHAAPCELVATA